MAGSKRSKRTPTTWQCLIKRLSKQQKFSSGKALFKAAAKEYKKMSKKQQQSKGRCKFSKSTRSKRASRK